MTAAQPKNANGAASHEKIVSLDGLRNLFSEMEEEKSPQKTIEKEIPVELTDKEAVVEETQEVAQAEAQEISPEAAAFDPEQIVTHESESGSASDPAPSITRSDLVNVLEGFVNLVRTAPDLGSTRDYQSPANQISFDPHQNNPNVTKIHVDDKTMEVEELRCLLVEAQETIIRLLTERVEDSARMAQLETELKLLPDLQAQADRALAAAINADDFRKDLHRVKFELERIRLQKVRHDLVKRQRSIWNRVRGWFFKTNDCPKPQAEK